MADQVETIVIRSKNLSKPGFDEGKAQAGSFKAEIDAIDKRMGGLGSSAVSLAGALGVAFSVGAVLNFGRQMIEDADALQSLHDKTSISVEGLQAMRIAGDDANVSLESMTAAVNMLQKRLGGDDTSALAALRDLGISVDEFKRLDGAAQMAMLSDAVRGMSDPLRVANDLSALFGKSWADQLPVLKRGFKELSDGTKLMSADTVQALADVNDALDKAARRAKGETAQAFNFLFLGWGKADREAEAMAQQISAMADRAAEAAPKITGLALADVGLAAASERARQQVERNEQAAKLAREAAKKAADEAERQVTAFRNSVESLTSSAVGARQAFGAFGLLMPDLSAQTAGVRIDFDALDASVNEFHHGLTVAGDEIETVTIPLFAALPAGLSGIAREMKATGTSLKTDLIGNLQQLPQMVASAFTGGGGLSGALKGVGAMVGSTLGQSVGKGIAALGSLGGPIGAAIGSLVGPAIGWITKLFSSAEKQVNPVRQAFVDLNGGLAALNAKAAEAGVTLTALLNAKNPEAYKKAIEDLNAAFAFQDNAMQTLNQTVEKYGFSTEQLGPKFAAQKLHERAGELLKDWEVLNAGQIDHVAIIEKMGPALQQYVSDSLSAGVAIPAAMRPALQAMLDMGLLTDANGDKLTDLEGLTFAETLDAKFSSLIDTIKQLTDAISRGLGGAINAIPREVRIGVGFDVDPINLPGERMAAGGSGVVTRPTLFLAGEAGRERYWFSGANKDTTPASSSGAAAVDLEPLRQELARMRRDFKTLSASMGRAVRDGMLATQ